LSHVFPDCVRTKRAVSPFRRGLPERNVWGGRVVEATQEPPGEIAAGARIREARKFLGKRMESGMEVTVYEPGGSSRLKVASGPIPFHVRQTVEPVGAGTKIDAVIEGEPRGFFRLAEPLVVRAVGRELASNLATLKDILEAGETLP
jgi:hypothetical protein